jgi:hypothetical protein
MSTTELQEQATRKLDAARREIGKALVGKPGNRAEVEYGQAYQQAVAAGLVPQIRKQYRDSKIYRS